MTEKFIQGNVAPYKAEIEQLKAIIAAQGKLLTYRAERIKDLQSGRPEPTDQEVLYLNSYVEHLERLLDILAEAFEERDTDGKTFARKYALWRRSHEEVVAQMEGYAVAIEKLTGLDPRLPDRDFIEVEPSDGERAAWPEQTRAYVESLEQFVRSVQHAREIVNG